MMWPYKRRIRRAERVRLEVLEQTIQTFWTQHAKCQEHGVVDTATVFNAAFYVLLFDRDFSALKEFFLASDNDWNRQVVGRQMAVMLYEGAKDLPDLFGKHFRAMLADNGVSQQRRNELDAVRSRLTTFRDRHAERLNELRNVMAAHRDKDVMAQLRVVDDLHPMEVYETSVAFWAVVRDLTPVLAGIISELGTPRMLLKQMAK